MYEELETVLEAKRRGDISVYQFEVVDLTRTLEKLCKMFDEAMHQEWERED